MGGQLGDWSCSSIKTLKLSKNLPLPTTILIGALIARRWYSTDLAFLDLYRLYDVRALGSGDDEFFWSQKRSRNATFLSGNVYIF
jgi:hypothetical protein